MFEINDNKPAKSDKINPIDQIKHLVDGGENMRISTKVMNGSKGSGNAYLLGEIKGVEVFRLQCGNLKDWSNMDELNMYVFSIMEQISAGFASYVEENKVKAEEMKQHERDKRAAHVEAIKVELGNAKGPSEIRKVLKGHGFHPAHVEALANNAAILLAEADRMLSSYAMGDI